MAWYYQVVLISRSIPITLAMPRSARSILVRWEGLEVARG
jgi:hypothetical protein